MIVVSHFRVDEAAGPSFADRARDALAAMGERPGYRRGWLGRAADDPQQWILGTEWDGVGAYRRALSSAPVRIRAATLLGSARDEPSAFEVLYDDGTGRPVIAASARAEDTGGETGGAPANRPRG